MIVTENVHYQCVKECRHESLVLQVGQGPAAAGDGIGLHGLGGAVHDVEGTVEGVHRRLDALILRAVDGPVVVGVHGIEIGRGGMREGKD